MKAYKAWNDKEDLYSTVVFAENISEAKKIAFRSDVLGEACWDFNWIDIRVKRVPNLDKEYRGQYEMNWDNPQDRAVMCKNGWECDDDCFDPDYCEECSGKDYCGKYAQYLDDLKADMEADMEAGGNEC